MDFSTHGRQRAPGPNTSRFTSVDSEQVQPVLVESKAPKTVSGHLWARVWLLLFLLCVAALVVAVLLIIGFDRPNSEAKYVDASAYQVVEVTGGSQSPTYYYGKISDVTANYLVLTDVAILTSKPSATTVSVAPLGCATPNGTSQLIINRNQVILWDNLSGNSAAAQAIQQLASSLSNGVCSTSSSNTTNQTQPAGPTQPTQTSPTGTTSGSVVLPRGNTTQSGSGSTSSTTHTP